MKADMLGEAAHDLRRTAANLPRYLRRCTAFMHHFSIKVTFDLYGHLMPGTEAEAAALLDVFLDPEDN